MLADITKFESLMNQASERVVTNGWKKNLALFGTGAGVALLAPWITRGYMDARALSLLDQKNRESAAQVETVEDIPDDKLGANTFGSSERVDQVYAAAGAPSLAETRELLQELRSKYPTIYNTLCSDSIVASKRFEFVKKHRSDFKTLLEYQKTNSEAYNAAMWQLRRGSRDQQDMALLFGQSPSFVEEALKLVESKPYAASGILQDIKPDAIRSFETTGRELQQRASDVRTKYAGQQQRTQQDIKDARSKASLPGKIIYSFMPKPANFNK